MHVSAVDKGFFLAGSGRPPLGSVQSRFVLMGGMGNGVSARYALGLKPANASGSNLFDTSRANQVNASSSQVLGMCPLRVTYTNPAAINSALQRHSVVRDLKPRLLTTYQATVKLPLLLPRYCPASSSSNLQAYGLRAMKAGHSNTLCTMPVNPSVYLLPLNLLPAMVASPAFQHVQPHAVALICFGDDCLPVRDDFVALLA